MQILVLSASVSGRRRVSRVFCSVLIWLLSGYVFRYAIARFSTQPVDWALGVLGYTSVQVPMRIFTPQIVTETGAKLSKSLIRDGDTSLEEVPEWILDMGKFEKHNPDYVDYIVWLVELFLSHPRHMYRSYSYQEIIRIFKQKK
jgi:hypothetical protein